MPRHPSETIAYGQADRMVFRVNTISPVLLAKPQVVVQANRPAADIETRLLDEWRKEFIHLLTQPPAS